MSEPKTTMDYIAEAIRNGARLEVWGDDFAQPVTHVSFVGGTGQHRVILRPSQCPCDCHDPTKGILMHSEACCEPYRS